MKIASLTLAMFAFFLGLLPAGQRKLGREWSMPRRLNDGDEYRVAIQDLIAYGKQLFCAQWTSQEGAGRPLAKGNGRPLSDPTAPLIGNRMFNRVSGPDANACMGCHNAPYGIPVVRCELDVPAYYVPCQKMS